MTFFRTNIQNISFSQKMTLFEGLSQESQVPPADQVKKSSKWIIWGGITGRGLTGLHFVPQEQTLTVDHYINNIIIKERSEASPSL